MSTIPQSSSKLTLVEALAELKDLQDQGHARPDGALTAAEWAVAWKVGVRKALFIIGRLTKGCRMTSHKVVIVDVAGRLNYTFVYKYVGVADEEITATD